MRAVTTKRRMPDDMARVLAKQARRERLVFRLIERRARWQSRQARTTAQLGSAV